MENINSSSMDFKTSLKQGCFQQTYGSSKLYTRCSLIIGIFKKKSAVYLTVLESHFSQKVAEN